MREFFFQSRATTQQPPNEIQLPQLPQQLGAALIAAGPFPRGGREEFR